MTDSIALNPFVALPPVVSTSETLKGNADIVSPAKSITALGLLDMLNVRRPHSPGVPLRRPDTPAAGGESGRKADPIDVFDFYVLLADLETDNYLAFSKRAVLATKLEWDAAQSSAKSKRREGVTALGGGIAKCSSAVALTGMSIRMQIKGGKKQLKSAEENIAEIEKSHSRNRAHMGETINTPGGKTATMKPSNTLAEPRHADLQKPSPTAANEESLPDSTAVAKDNQKESQIDAHPPNENDRKNATINHDVANHTSAIYFNRSRAIQTLEMGVGGIIESSVHASVAIEQSAQKLLDANSQIAGRIAQSGYGNRSGSEETLRRMATTINQVASLQNGVIDHMASATKM